MIKYPLVIFDMDGTLTEDRLDFPAIRRDIGVPTEVGILEHLARLDPAARAHAAAILDRHELAAAETCAVHEGAADLLAYLRANGVKTALLTRNSARCAQRILARHAFLLDHVASREDVPHKPHPGSILNITQKFAIAPNQALMVGDYLYDLQAAAAAGTDSALYLAGATSPPPPFAALATYRVTHLSQLAAIIIP